MNDAVVKRLILRLGFLQLRLICNKNHCMYSIDEADVHR